jgi:type I restriction enzyme M protein
MIDDIKDLSGLVWSVTDLLRGDYKQSDYGRVIVPMTVLRRLDCRVAWGNLTPRPSQNRT